MSEMVTEQVAQKTADSAAFGSSFLVGAAWIAEVEPYITVAATLVAIIAGAGAAWFHIERARMLRLQRKREEAKDDE